MCTTRRQACKKKKKKKWPQSQTVSKTYQRGLTEQTNWQQHIKHLVTPTRKAISHIQTTENMNSSIFHLTFPYSFIKVFFKAYLFPRICSSQYWSLPHMQEPLLRQTKCDRSTEWTKAKVHTPSNHPFQCMYVRVEVAPQENWCSHGTLKFPGAIANYWH